MRAGHAGGEGGCGAQAHQSAAVQPGGCQLEPHQREAGGPFTQAEDLEGQRLLRSALDPWRTWFAAHKLDWPEPGEGSQFNDVGLMCDAAAAGMGIALVRLKLAAPWLDSGALVRLGTTPPFTESVPSPHAHYLCWRTGTMDRWECAAFSDWLRQALA